MHVQHCMLHCMTWTAESLTHWAATQLMARSCADAEGRGFLRVLEQELAKVSDFFTAQENELEVRCLGPAGIRSLLDSACHPTLCHGGPSALAACILSAVALQLTLILRSRLFQSLP